MSKILYRQLKVSDVGIREIALKMKSYCRKVIPLFLVFIVLGTSTSFAITKQEINNDSFTLFDARQGHRYFNGGTELTGEAYDMNSIEISSYDPPNYTIDISKYVTSGQFSGMVLYRERYFYNFNTKEISMQHLSYTKFTEDGQEQYTKDEKGRIFSLTNIKGTAEVDISNRREWKNAIQIWKSYYGMPFLL